jgi:hypothetical protein
MRDPAAFSYSIKKKESEFDASPSVAFLILLFIILVTL